MIIQIDKNQIAEQSAEVEETPVVMNQEWLNDNFPEDNTNVVHEQQIEALASSQNCGIIDFTENSPVATLIIKLIE